MTTWTVAARGNLIVGTQLDFSLLGTGDDWPPLAAGDLISIMLPDGKMELGTILSGSIGTAEFIVGGTTYRISPATRSDGAIIPQHRASLWIIRSL